MPYIGNTVQNQGFAPAIDYFSGNGVTVTFTLSRPIASVAQIICAIDNVIQNPSSAFTVSGNSITFTSAPLSGTNNIWVEYTSLITTYAAISQDPSVIGDITASGGYLSTGDFGNSYIDGIVVDYVTGNARLTTGPLDDMTFYHGGTASRSEMMKLYYAGGAKIYGTTALTIPSGTTAQRPGTPENGMLRYNSTLSQNEIYQGGTWNTFSFTYAVEVIAVAGGGGGGCYCGGGGGAGGLVYATSTLTASTAYTVIVGAAGTGGLGGANNSGTNGTNSSLGTTLVVATGGGGGAYGYNGNATTGNSGGSGGGSTQASNASGTVGQGNNGGQGTTSASQGGGGGGGAGVVGGNGSVGIGGIGGNGLNTYSAWASATSTGASGYYAGGGGGGDGSGSAEGTGGLGGGGNGRGGTGGGSAGTANTGGGGGGGGYPSTDGYNGGSGIVIIRYAGVQRGTGGTVVTTGGYTYHTFTTSGTYTA